MLKLGRKFKKDKSGVTAIEYGLIAGLVAVVIIGVLTTSGTALSGMFTKINTELNKAAGTTP